VSSTRYASFLVRLWRTEPDADQATATWKGELEHIQTSRRFTFATLTELVHLLNRQLEEANLAEPGDRAEAGR
jgi:hypothetical protein